MKRVIISWYSDDPQTLDRVTELLASMGAEMKVVDVSDDDGDEEALQAHPDDFDQSNHP